jgi:hypothetical protein
MIQSTAGSYLTEKEASFIEFLSIGDAIAFSPISAVGYVIAHMADADQETKKFVADLGVISWQMFLAGGGMAIAAGGRKNPPNRIIKKGMRLQMLFENSILGGIPGAAKNSNINVGIGWSKSGKPTILVTTNRGASKLVKERVEALAKRKGITYIDPNTAAKDTHGEPILWSLLVIHGFVRMDIFSSNYNCPTCTQKGLSLQGVRLYDIKPYEGFRATGNPNSPVPKDSRPLFTPQQSDPLNRFLGYP